MPTFLYLVIAFVANIKLFLQSILPKHDRRLAESHYSIALAYSFYKDYKKAIEHYQATLSVLESRIGKLCECNCKMPTSVINCRSTILLYQSVMPSRKKISDRIR